MARGKKSGGRRKGTPNKKSSMDDLEKLLKPFTPAEIAKAFKKAKKSVGNGKTIIEHLAEKSFTDNSLALALLKKLTPDKRAKEEAVIPPGTEWADRTPRDVVEEMDNLTVGENPETQHNKGERK